MNKVLLLCCVVLVFCGCRDRSLLLAENSVELVFNDSWTNCAAYNSAEKMYVFESPQRGYATVSQLTRHSLPLGVLEKPSIRRGIEILRSSLRRTDTVGAEERQQVYKILLVGEDQETPLAYWDIRVYENKLGKDAYCVMFPTGGVFVMTDIGLFIAFCNNPTLHGEATAESPQSAGINEVESPPSTNAP